MLQLVFGLTAALLPFVTLVSPMALNHARQIQWPDLPNNLTQDVLDVANAISPPCAANNTYCQQLTAVVIPRCERLRGDPGCWCGNHDPLHYCAICMSNPTDNQTTPDQTQAATAGHNAFHVACNAYEQLINGTVPLTTSSSSMTSTTPTSTPTVAAANTGNDKTPVGAIVGGVVGGVVGLAAVVGIIWLISIVLMKDNRRDNVRPSSVSHLSSDFRSPATFHAPYPQLTSYPAPGHVSPPVSTYMHNPEPMVISPSNTQPSSQAPLQHEEK